MIDAVELQVLTGALQAVCEEMGAVLIRSAHSANIKERRDASTALFDREGEMVMQAEHIPVHLGAMPAAVAAVPDVQRALASGSVQVVDARAADRFRGEVPEPRPGLRSGHMPGSFNVPFDRVLDKNTLAPRDRIAAAFTDAGVDLNKPIITS